MNLFQLGDFTLNSGAKSKWKIECDLLTDDDIECLAEMISYMVGPFVSVQGVPRGGLRLAEALRSHTVAMSERHLIVDDVLTTGGSMERLRGEVSTRGEIIGAVIFARGQCPGWIKAVFQMPETFWTKPRYR